MKKFLIVFLAVIMSLQLCACTQTETETTTQPQITTVGLCVRQKADAPEYYDAIVAQLIHAEYEVVVCDSKNDQSLQDQQVLELLAGDCDLLIVEPVMVTALESVIGKAKESNVSLLIMDREPDAAVLESYADLYYVGCRSAEAGAAQAQLLQTMNLRGDLNEDGVISYMMLRGPEDHLDAQLITDNCIQGLENYETELICTVYTQWDTDSARADCARGLAQFGRDVEVIFCNHADLAAGAVQAVESRGWTPGQDIYIVAVDNNVTLQALMDKGAVFGTVAAGTQQRVTQIVNTARTILEGGKPPKCTYVSYDLLTIQP